MKSILRTIKSYAFMFSLLRKSYPQRLFVLPISIILNAARPFVFIFFPAVIIDNLTNGADIKTILLYIAIMCLSAFVISFVTEVLDEYDSVWEACFAFQVTGTLLEKYMEIDMEDIETADIYNKYSMANTALDYGVGYFIDSIKEISTKVLELIAASIIIATLHPLVIIVIIGFTVLLSYIQKIRLKEERKFDESVIPERRKYNYYYNTSNDFQYGKEIRIYNIRKSLIARVEALNEKYIKSFKDTKKKAYKYQIIYNIINLIQHAGIYCYMIFSFSIQSISIGYFTIYLGSIERFKNALNSISQSIVKINDMGLRIVDLKKFLSIDSKMSQTHREGIGVDSCSHYDIRFVNVGFHYPNSDIMVLKDINITIPYGEKLTIVGENGAGKSTFIKLLLRIYDPTEGDIYLGDINIRDIPLEEYHSILAAVFQDYRMLSFTIKDNITFGKESSEDEKYLYDILDSLYLKEKVEGLHNGINTYMNRDYEEDGLQMSGGETQKIAIARAMNRNASIYVMDEPASALDAIAEADLYSLFCKVIGMNTCIFISHRMSTARFGNKIALFDGGRITEYGTYSEMLRLKGKFYEMYCMQAKYYVDDISAAERGEGS